MVGDINNSKDYENAISNNKVVIIHIHATWAAPSKLMLPHFLRLSREVEGVEFFKLDADEVPNLVSQLDIRVMPTVIFFEDGVKVDELVGADPNGLEARVLKYREKLKAEGEAASSSVTSQ